MTGRSLPDDLQLLPGARGAAGVRSPSAGISEARSRHRRPAATGLPLQRTARPGPALAPPPVPGLLTPPAGRDPRECRRPDPRSNPWKLKRPYTGE